MKMCPDCGSEKPVTEYGMNASRPDGLAFYCKPCFRRRANLHYRKKRALAGAVVREPFVAPDGHKRCARCASVKPVSEFHQAPGQADGLSSYCKDCRPEIGRSAHLKHKYGLTTAQFEQLLADQDGRCACCRERKAKHVDHDHVTGVVRGVVCFPCNVAIGQFGDRTQLMRNAIEYLERTTWQKVRISTGVFQLTSPRPAAAASATSSQLRHLISSRPD